MVSISLSASGKLDKSGGTLTGPLILERDPLGDLEAATRRWVLTQIGSGGGGGVQIGGDLGGTDSAPTVIGAHLTAPLPLAQGGTNAADAPGARTQLGLGTAATANAGAFDAAGAATSALAAAEANAAATYIPLTSAGANSGVATLDSSGHLTAGQAANLLAIANNLSDLQSAPTARTNLGLGSASTQSAAAFDASGAAVAAQIAAQTFATSAVATETTRAQAAEAAKLAISNNLSDLGNPVTARTSLGLGSAATQASSAFDAAGAASTAQGAAQTFATNAVSTETTRATAAEASKLAIASNLSDVAAPATARGNLGAAKSGANSDITSLTGLTTPLSLAEGGTGSAAQNFVDLTTGQSVAGVKAFSSSPTGPTPAGASDLAPKSYVDSVAAGLSVKASARLATTAALPANIYSNGASGVGATLTGVSVGVLSVDGSAVGAGDRILVQNEATAANNGLYSCTVAGAVGAAYVLTRTTDMNSAAQIPGAFVFTEAGTVNTGAGFVIAGAGPYTIGTTAIAWTQFSGAGEITAGTGLSKSGNTLSLATPVAIGLGGTGQATQQAAINALAGAVTAGRFLRGDGANATLAAIQAADVPTLNQSTTGTAAGLSATLAVGSGGTGATAAPAALANLGAVASDWCDMLGLGLLTAPLTDSAVTYQQTPGDLVLCLCTPSKTRSISTLGIWVTAAGATGSGVNALMLFSEAGVLIDQTGDMTAAFSSTGMAEGAMGGAHTVTAGTNYYLAFLTHFSGTSPHFAATGTTQTANFPVTNGHYTAVFKGGQGSVPLSFTPSSYTPNSGYFIMYGR